MTHAGVTRNPRRSYGSMKRKGNKNKKTHFVPSDQQILICQRRIKGALTRRCKGWLTRSSCADIEKTLVGMVYSRDGALGNNPDEVCLTVKAALKQMQQGTGRSKRRTLVSCLAFERSTPSATKASLARECR
jgi:hypothetical protein